MVTVSKYYSKVVRQGTRPTNEGNPADQPVVPVNPPGTNPVLNAGVGIKLDGQVIGGVKRYIQSGETLVIPEFWQYNIHGLTLSIDGTIINDGEINIG